MFKEIGEECPKQTPINYLSPEEKKELFDYWEKFDVESWIERFSEYTPQSLFIPLDMKLIKSLSKSKNEYIEEDKENLQIFEKNIEDEVKKLRNWKKGFFIRLNTRSPKDAATYSSKLIPLFLSNFSSIKDLKNKNEVACGVRRGLIEALRCHSSSDALSLLLTSERVSTDFRLYADMLETKQLTLVLREWIDFPIEFEFRGFVCEGKLTALSQYSYDCFFPQLKKQKNKIEKKIQQFFYSKISPILIEKNAIVDFCYTNDKIWIVELNPFDTYTGSGLFDWGIDWKVLTKGPFEFRIVENEKKVRKQAAVFWSWSAEIDEAISLLNIKREKERKRNFVLVLLFIILFIVVFLFGNFF